MRRTSSWCPEGRLPAVFTTSRLLLLGLAVSFFGLVCLSRTSPGAGGPRLYRGNLRINLARIVRQDLGATTASSGSSSSSSSSSTDNIGASSSSSIIDGIAAAATPPPPPAHHYLELPAELRVPPRSAKVHVVTTVHKQPCERTMVGNWIEMLSVKNKEDFARVRGYTLHWFANDVNASMHGNWNKVAAIRTVLEQVQPADNEWLLWIDSDALFLGLDVVIPFHNYEGRHIVMWAGNDEAMKEQADPIAFNSGVILIRNSLRSRQFMRDLAEYGTPDWTVGGKYEPLLKKDVKNWRPGLPNQVGMAHLLRTKPQYRQDVVCTDLHLHRMWHWDWSDSDLGVQPDPLVLHWPGCQFCSPKNSQFDNKECVSSFLTTYARADARLAALLGSGAPFDTTLIEGVLDKVF